MGLNMKNYSEWIDDINLKLQKKKKEAELKRKRNIRVIASSISFIIVAVILIFAIQTNNRLNIHVPPTGSNTPGPSDSIANNPTDDTTVTPPVDDPADNDPDPPDEDPNATYPPIQTDSLNINVINKIEVIERTDNKDYTEKILSAQEWADYIGVDLLNLNNYSFFPTNLQYYESGSCSSIFRKNGEIVYDSISFTYIDPYALYTQQLTINASKLGNIDNKVYTLESNEYSTINSTTVLIGAMSNYYFAEFQLQDVYYRIESQGIVGYQFFNILNGIIQIIK